MIAAGRGARFLAALAATALACLAPISAVAQEPVEIVPGRTVTGKASTANTPNLYYFVGESGATVTFEVEAPGLVSVALLTSDGDAMLEASGTGSARLEAVLSLTDVFYVAVVRSDANAPHTITMAAQAPDFDLALFSTLVGYGYTDTWSDGSPSEVSSCWIEPGAVVRARSGTFVVYWELLRNGRRRGYLQYPGIPRLESKVSVNDGMMELTITANGETTTHSELLSEQTFARPDEPSLHYTTYLCD